MGIRVRVTKAEALRMFRDTAHPFDMVGAMRGDDIAKREAWSNFIDMLNKDGLVSDKQADTWTNPY